MLKRSSENSIKNGGGFLVPRFKRAGTCLALTLLLSSPAIVSCGPTTTGAVKEDITVTGESKRLEEGGLKYRGPEYNVAILTFANKTPSKATNLGEAATEILRTIVKQAGLEPILLSDEEMRSQEELIRLQQTGAVKTGKKNAAEGFDTLDYRISGAITSYAELEEGSDYLVTKSKTPIARVQVDYALVDVATGKSLVAESGMGEYKKGTRTVFGMGGKSTADMSLREGALRDAMTKAMSRMIEKLNALPFKGRVLAVDGATVVVRAGTRSRLEPGAALDVYRPGQDLVDPDTGRVIGKREKKIGELILKDHQSERISEAEVKSGAGFAAGDIIKAVK